MYLLIISLCVISLAESTPQKEDDCGIVGGDPADIKDVPYQLSLRYKTQHLCGASIISHYWAVSAAHCKTPNVTLTLVAGASLLSQGGSVHRIVKFISHPSKDIAVLKVKKRFPLGSPGVKCIALASKPPTVGALAITSGWGATEEGVNKPTNQLRKVLVPILSNKDCRKAYPELTELMICAGYKAGGKDSCQGDSGGPLVVNNKLIGVVSEGKGCARPGIPGVYVRVDKLYKWIRKVTRNSQC